MVLLLIVPGALYGVKLARQGVHLTKSVNVRTARLLVAVILAFITGNLFLVSIRSLPAFAWYLPLPVEYYNVPGLWLFNVSSMAFVFSAISALSFATRHPARWLVPAICIDIFTAVEFHFRTSPLIAPAEVTIDQVDKDGVVLQSSGATCGAAACANAARFLGRQITEKEMVALLGTTDAGTSPAQIVYAMRKMGFASGKRHVRDRDITRVAAPAILFVKAGPDIDGHVVTFAGMTNGKAEIWGPSFGKKFIAVQDLQNDWGGRAIEIAGR